MPDRRSPSHFDAQAAEERRAEQGSQLGRAQTLALILLAAAVVALWLLRARPGWIFPAGWWRL